MPSDTADLPTLVGANLPRDFLIRLRDAITAAYAAAKDEADRRAEGRPLYNHRLGHCRHFEREEALYRAAQTAGLVAVDAAPLGYPKVIIETPRLRLMELKVARWGDLPSDSPERRSLAASNPIGGSFSGQMNWFADQAHEERMLAYVVVVNPTDDDDELPGAIGIGIPTANLDDWAFLESLEAILAAGADVTGDTAPPVDRAHPKLRKDKKKDQDNSS